MIDKHIREKIEKRAFEIYEFRKANGIGGNATTDWFEAQEEIITDRRIEGCPKCGGKLLARKNNTIICLKNGCDFQVERKRKLDEDIPDFNEIKKEFNG